MSEQPQPHTFAIRSLSLGRMINDETRNASRSVFPLMGFPLPYGCENDDQNDPFSRAKPRQS